MFCNIVKVLKLRKYFRAKESCPIVLNIPKQQTLAETENKRCWRQKYTLKLPLLRKKLSSEGGSYQSMLVRYIKKKRLIIYSVKKGHYIPIFI